MAVEAALELAFAGALGLCLGSFGCLAAERLPQGRSIGGRSACGGCARRLGTLDLVPVAGYLLRRGRCAGCGARIPLRYPALEGAAGVVMAAAVGWLGPPAGAAAGLAVLAVLFSALALLAPGSRRPG